MGFRMCYLQQQMADRPLWKKVGLHNAKMRTEGARSPLQHNSMTEYSSSQGTRRRQQLADDRMSDSKNVAMKGGPSSNINKEEAETKEEEIFQSCISRFKEVSQSEPKTSGYHCEKSIGRRGLGPIKEIEISQTNKTGEQQAKEQTRRIASKMKQLLEVFNTFKEMVIDSKEQIELERKKYEGIFKTMANKLNEAIAFLTKGKDSQEISTQTDKSSGFKNSRHLEDTQITEQGHEDLLFVRTGDSIKRKEFSHSVAKSENQQQRDKSFIENLELRQKINVLTTCNQMLESEIEHLKMEYEQEKSQKQKARIEDIQSIYSSNKTLLKQTIQKYMQELFAKDHIISSLKAQLNQKNQQLIKLESNKIENTNGPYDSGISNIYTRRYKQLYQKVQAERLKLRTELDSIVRQKEDVKAELYALRMQSGSVVQQNIELMQKMQDLTFQSAQKVNQLKSIMTRDSKLREAELNRQIASLKNDIQMRDRKIQFLDRIIAKNKQTNFNPSIRIEDREEDKSQMSDQVQQPGTNRAFRPPAVMESIRSLPGINSPVNNARNSNLRQTFQDVSRLSNLNPKFERKQSQPNGRGSMAFISSPLRRQNQGQSRQLSKHSLYLNKVGTQRGSKDRLFDLVQNPRTPNNIPRLDRFRSYNIVNAGQADRKSLSEQVQTLSNMMKNELECSSRRKAF